MDDLSGSRILITGASGFVGANLIRYLLPLGASVYAFVRPETDLWRLREVMPRLRLLAINLTDLAETYALIQSIRPHFVYHLATIRQHEDWVHLIHTNITATINVMKACQSPNLCRFIYAGSSMEYGDIHPPLQESASLRPSTFYGASKAAATMFVQQLAIAEQYPVVNLRMFYVYGYWESAHRLIPTAIRCALNNEKLRLTDADYRRDYVFIEDAVAALFQASQVAGIEGKIFNIASGQQRSNREVVATVETVVGKPIDYQIGDFPARQWDRLDWVADIHEAQKQLQWTAAHHLEDGIRKTFDWTMRSRG